MILLVHLQLLLKLGRVRRCPDLGNHPLHGAN
jgi:hypothetical protein